MSGPEIVLVVARADNGVIGRDNGLPWRIPADLKRFKALTMGGGWNRGRKRSHTPGRRVPGPRHIVLTRAGGWRAEGAEVAGSVAEALALVGDAPRVSVIGGAEIFALFMDAARRIELTEVHGDIAGDTVMPPPDPTLWGETAREDHPALGDAPAHSFVTLTRRDA